MVSPVSGIYAKVRQKFHLSPLFKFPEPALPEDGDGANPGAAFGSATIAASKMAAIGSGVAGRAAASL